mgnify:CR=1 FL=1
MGESITSEAKPQADEKMLDFSEESNIEYRTRNNECRRWIRKLHNSKFLVRYSYFNTSLNRPDMLENFLTLHFRLVRVMGG